MRSGYKKSLQYLVALDNLPNPETEPQESPDKEAIDEIIYNTKNLRDRLIPELQARCGLRIGDSLKIKVSDISERKIVLLEPKSGKGAEVAYMPEPIAKRMEEYIRTHNLQPEDRLFPVSYSTARSMIKGLGAQLKDFDKAPRPPPAFSDLCQPKRGTAGDRVQGDSEASGPENHPSLSGQGQRVRSHPVDGYHSRKIVGFSN